MVLVAKDGFLTGTENPHLEKADPLPGRSGKYVQYQPVTEPQESYSLAPFVATLMN